MKLPWRIFSVLLLAVGALAMADVPVEYRIELRHEFALNLLHRDGPTWESAATASSVPAGCIERTRAIYRGVESEIIEHGSLPAVGGNPPAYRILLKNGWEITLQPWKRQPRLMVVRVRYTEKGMEIFAPQWLNRLVLMDSTLEFAWLWTN